MKLYQSVAAILLGLTASTLASADDAPASFASPTASAAASAAPTAAPAAPDAAPKVSAEDAAEAEAKDHTPVRYEMSLNIQKVSKLELGPGTFDADFLLSYRCDKAPCKPSIALENGEIKGKPEKLVDEPLRKVFRVKAELAADIDLSDFPFDHHILTIDVVDHDATDVTFVVDDEEKGDASDVKIPGWEVVGDHTEVEAEDIGSGLKVSHYQYGVEVKRPTIAAIAKNLMPAMVMVLVLLVSLFMKPKMAPARLAAGTGSFVAVIMFHNTAANQLPPLGFLTLLDKFMFSLYLLWLVHISFSIGILRADEKKDEALSDKLYRLAWKVLPAVAAVAWGIVFSKLV